MRVTVNTILAAASSYPFPYPSSSSTSRPPTASPPAASARRSPCRVENAHTIADGKREDAEGGAVEKLRKAARGPKPTVLARHRHRLRVRGVAVRLLRGRRGAIHVRCVGSDEGGAHHMGAKQVGEENEAEAEADGGARAIGPGSDHAEEEDTKNGADSEPEEGDGKVLEPLAEEAGPDGGDDTREAEGEGGDPGDVPGGGGERRWSIDGDGD